MKVSRLDGERFNRPPGGLFGPPPAKGVALVTEAGAAPLGWAMGLLRRGKGGAVGTRVYALAVHPNARGLRIGHRLLTQLLEELSRRGTRRVWLEVRAENLAAIELYRKHGFVEDRKLASYYGRGIHGLRMVRETTGQNQEQRTPELPQRKMASSPLSGGAGEGGVYSRRVGGKR